MEPVPLTNFTDQPSLARLSDGVLLAFFTLSPAGVDAVTARYVTDRVVVRSSTDDGRTWSDARPVFALPEEAGGWFQACEAIADDQGEVHLFFLNDAHTGVVPRKQGKIAGEDQRPAVGAIRARLDIWHTRSTNQRTAWPLPKRIWQGYTGALNSVLQLRSGRLVLPFSYLTARAWRGDRGGGAYQFGFAGQYDCTVLCSDDRGATWHPSPAALKTPVPDIVSAYGAVEPVIVDLNDGRVWMLIRTQLGRFYESFSADGIEWSEPQPTSIVSSDSPAGLVRLDDRRIVLFWNCSLRFPYAFGGRHVLHAAVTENDGRTWRGYREVSRDPVRDQPPPPEGDHGTGYPYPTVRRDGQIILSTGLGPGKDICRLVDPAWLDETRHKDNFAHGLDEWSVFGTKGVELVPHPDKKRGCVLLIRKTHADWPAAAVWNFPAGQRGRLRLKLFAKNGFAGARLGLADHFSVPFDREDIFHNLFNLRLGPGGIELPAERWCVLQCRWDCARRRCVVALEGKRRVVLAQTRESASGPFYLRLVSTAGGIDEAGFAIESANVGVRR